jgi:hypothetical protein
MMRAISLIVAVLLLATSGIVQGLWTDRWGVSTELEAAAARLETIPMVVGEWHAEEERPISDEELTKAEALGHISRTYRHRIKGEVDLLLLCGRPGPIAVHTPDICFRGNGFKLEGDAKSVPMAQGDFGMIRVGKAKLLAEHLRVFWSWNSGKGWSVPKNPRITFAGNKFLYKLYVVRTEKPDESVNDDPAVEFLQILLPTLEKHLSLAAPE